MRWWRSTRGSRVSWEPMTRSSAISCGSSRGRKNKTRSLPYRRITFQEYKTVLPVQFLQFRVLHVIFYPVDFRYKIYRLVDITRKQPRFVIRAVIDRFFLLHIIKLSITLIPQAMHIAVFSLLGDEKIDGGSLGISFHFRNDHSRSPENDKGRSYKKSPGGLIILA